MSSSHSFSRVTVTWQAGKHQHQLMLAANMFCRHAQRGQELRAATARVCACEQRRGVSTL